MSLRGDRLRDLRIKNGFTQEELAERLDLGLRQIHRYENGETDPSGDIVARIAKELRVTTDYLLGTSDDPTLDIEEATLSPMERLLILALRQGRLREAMIKVTEIAADPSDDDQK